VYLVGLTGGIAAGKTAVAARWVELGALEIDADLLARQAVAPGSIGLKDIVSLFGDVILSPDGALDRAKLAELVFENQRNREQLEAIVHPIVRALAAERLEACQKEAVVIYTVPLLVEAEVDHAFDIVVTVEAPEEVRVQRMMQTRGMTRQQAESRLKSQASPAERANRADVILNSNQSLQLLLKDADSLWKRFIREASDKLGA
jgi:dephospho-CoA kinase